MIHVFSINIMTTFRLRTSRKLLINGSSNWELVEYIRAQSGQGVLSKDSTVWLDGGRPPPVSLIMSLASS